MLVLILIHHTLDLRGLMSTVQWKLLLRTRSVSNKKAWKAKPNIKFFYKVNYKAKHNLNREYEMKLVWSPETALKAYIDTVKSVSKETLLIILHN
jgi:hypothetical protein